MNAVKMNDYMSEVDELERLPELPEYRTNDKLFENLNENIKDEIDIEHLINEDNDIMMTHKDDPRSQFVKGKNKIIVGTSLTIRNYLKCKIALLINKESLGEIELVAYSKMIPKNIFNCIIEFIKYSLPLDRRDILNYSTPCDETMLIDEVLKYDHVIMEESRISHRLRFDKEYSLNVFNTLDILRQLTSLPIDDTFRNQFIKETDEYYVINDVYIKKPHGYKLYKSIEAFPFMDDGITLLKTFPNLIKRKDALISFKGCKEVGLFDTCDIDGSSIKHVRVNTIQIFTVTSHFNGGNYKFKVVYIDQGMFNYILSQYTEYFEPVNFKVNVIRDIRSSVLIKGSNIILVTDNDIKMSKVAIKQLYISSDRLDESNNFIVNYSLFICMSHHNDEEAKRPLNLFYYKYDIETGREFMIDRKKAERLRERESISNFRFNLINCITQYPPISLYNKGIKYYVNEDCKYEMLNVNRKPLNISEFI